MTAAPRIFWDHHFGQHNADAARCHFDRYLPAQWKPEPIPCASPVPGGRGARASDCLSSGCPGRSRVGSRP